MAEDILSILSGVAIFLFLLGLLVGIIIGYNIGKLKDDRTTRKMARRNGRIHH
jgi:membrane protein DedA with SNARE-associated domain